MKARIISLTVIGALLVTAGYFFLHDHQASCQVCGRPMHAATFFRMTLEDGSQVETCCARCGLHFREQGHPIQSAEVADFTTGEPTDAFTAWYVANSSVNLCTSSTSEVREDRSGSLFNLSWDRCEPSLIGFRKLEDAQAFAHQHGGSVKSHLELALESPEGH